MLNITFFLPHSWYEDEKYALHSTHYTHCTVGMGICEWNGRSFIVCSIRRYSCLSVLVICLRLYKTWEYRKFHHSSTSWVYVNVLPIVRQCYICILLYTFGRGPSVIVCIMCVYVLCILLIWLLPHPQAARVYCVRCVSRISFVGQLVIQPGLGNMTSTSPQRQRISTSILFAANPLRRSAYHANTNTRTFVYRTCKSKYK